MAIQQPDGLEPWEESLRPADRLFVREFLIDMNTYQAAIRCGYAAKSARTESHKIIKRPAIAKAICAAMLSRAEALNVTAKLVLAEAFRSYLLAIEAKQYGAAARFLEMCGRHVDVQAFRQRVGLDLGDSEPVEFDLSKLSTDGKKTVLHALELLGAVQSEPIGEGASRLN